MHFENHNHVCSFNLRPGSITVYSTLVLLCKSALVSVRAITQGLSAGLQSFNDYVDKGICFLDARFAGKEYRFVYKNDMLNT